MIPRVIHVIWVGDDSKRPDRFIDSWRQHNPTWQLKVWGNRDYRREEWALKSQMETLWGRELNGVADMLRWEILLKHGGFATDADAECIRPLDDHLFDVTAFAAWENELARPGLVAAGAMAFHARDPLLKRIVERIARRPTNLLTSWHAWKTVGPRILTEEWRAHRFSHLTVYPSHYFFPRHYTGGEYKGAGPVYARQSWGSTRGLS